MKLPTLRTNLKSNKDKQKINIKVMNESHSQVM